MSEILVRSPEKSSREIRRLSSATGSDDILINPTDFNSIEVRLCAFRNPATGTEIRDPGRLLVHEFREQGLVVEVPSRCCAAGHVVVVELAATMPGNPMNHELVATCRVESLETTEDKTDRIAIVLVQFDEETWQSFQALFSGRQEQINLFLEAAKG